MSESFYQMICQMGTFMICARTIIHFRPRESYGKYLKMLLSLMILVQIFQPFSNFFFGNTTEHFQEQVASFQEEMEQRMQAAAESAVLSEQKLQEMTLLEVQERLREQQEKDETKDGGAHPVIEEQAGETEVVPSDKEKRSTSGQDNQVTVEKVEIKVEWEAEKAE